MKLSFPGREHVRFNPAHDERRVLDEATARQQCNHTQQYLSTNAQEAKMLFRPTRSELQATARLGCAAAAATGGAHGAAGRRDGGAQPAPHKPRVRATPAEEHAELRKRAAEASQPRRGAWPYRVLGVMRDATAAVLKLAFRRLSLRLHPDKNAQADRAEANRAGCCVRARSGICGIAVALWMRLACVGGYVGRLARWFI